MKQLWVKVSAVVFVCCLLGGLALGWFAVRQPVLHGLTVSDSVEVYTTEPAAILTVTWRLAPSGEVTVSVRLGGGYAVPAARVFLVLACDARLEGIEYTTGTGFAPPDEDFERSRGDEAGCGQPGAAGKGYQLATATLAGEQTLEITGRPVAEWTTSAGGVRLARSPGLSALSVTPDESNAPPLHHQQFPELAAAGAQAPAEARLWAVIQATDSEVRESVQGPARSEERLDNTVTDWGGSIVDSATWEGTGSLWEGVARWSDPGKQAQAQLALLAAGVLLGVAAAVLVETAIEVIRARD